ncbi:MAG TPA: translation initiation factor IF-3 [Firmicutes bacterium]|nr:translation initiation factor IF-3 [Bacillota bacterium]
MLVQGRGTGGKRFPLYFLVGGAGVIIKDLRVNQAIKAREVRLVSPEGEQLGIVSLKDALKAAADRGLDLVEVAPTAKPPVCRIMDFGKYKYEQAKKDREAKKKQKISELKEIKVRPTIDDHDFDVKLRSVRRFLADGDRVRIVVMFRGREIVHLDIGKAILERFAKGVADSAVVEKVPKVEGKNMTMTLAPKLQPVPQKEKRSEASGEVQA